MVGRGTRLRLADPGGGACAHLLVLRASGHHDTLCGTTAAGQSNMLLGALKHGLGVADVAPSVSFFKGVRVGGDGSLVFTGSAGPGAAVDLLIHLPVVVLLSNTLHRWTPNPHRPISTCWRGGPGPN